MTLTLTDLLMIVVTVSVVLIVVYLIRLASQLTRASAEAEELIRNMNHLRPQFERLLEEAERELAEIRTLTQKAGGIVGDVGAVTNTASRLAVPALSSLSSLAGPMRYASAALAGAKIGLKVLASRKRNKED
jgi:ABC-type cobalt transport system substrate-binding protein